MARTKPRSSPKRRTLKGLQVDKTVNVFKSKFKTSKNLERKRSKLFSNLVENLNNSSEFSDTRILSCNNTFTKATDNPKTEIDNSIIIISDDDDDDVALHFSPKEIAPQSQIRKGMNTSTPKHKHTDMRFFKCNESVIASSFKYNIDLSILNSSIFIDDTNNNLLNKTLRNNKVAKMQLLKKIFMQLVDANIVQKAQVKKKESLEDSYIRRVLKKKTSNVYGANLYNPFPSRSALSGPRLIIVDGSNVAMGQTHGKYFSVEALEICIDYFLLKGHQVKAFVPRFRSKQSKCSNPELLRYLERKRLVVYTPSREVAGRFINSYDDRYIVQCAAEFDGVIVSNDNYRDLLRENESWRYTIENNLLPYTWVDNLIIFPDDPLGRNGPNLHVFLQHFQPNRG